jgi:D-sedoheptulose 7-phosphate isomerase
MIDTIKRYKNEMYKALECLPYVNIELFGKKLNEIMQSGDCLYLCGNGGSAGNAMHLANDFIYGAGLTYGRGIRVEALTSNSSVLTCLANDIGYENIFSEQLRVKGTKGDILLVLSGSGNSPNIINAIKMASSLEMQTFGIFGYDGGICSGMVDVSMHTPVSDMQIAEDLQLIICHMCMQYLCIENKGPDK